MKREAVSSSNIRSIGYDATQSVLEVEFSSGSVYQYTGVPADLAEKMAKADSVGRFFAQNVRLQFDAKRVDADAA